MNHLLFSETEFPDFRVTGRSDPLMVTTPPSALPRTLTGSPRSASIAGLSTAWRSPGYNTISEEPMDDRYPLIEPMRPIDEAPPPYEVFKHFS